MVAVNALLQLGMLTLLFLTRQGPYCDKKAFIVTINPDRRPGA